MCRLKTRFDSRLCYAESPNLDKVALSPDTSFIPRQSGVKTANLCIAQGDRKGHRLRAKKARFESCCF